MLKEEKCTLAANVVKKSSAASGIPTKNIFVTSATNPPNQNLRPDHTRIPTKPVPTMPYPAEGRRTVF